MITSIISKGITSDSWSKDSGRRIIKIPQGLILLNHGTNTNTDIIIPNSGIINIKPEQGQTVSMGANQNQTDSSQAGPYILGGAEGVLAMLTEVLKNSGNPEVKISGTGLEWVNNITSAGIDASVNFHENDPILAEIDQLLAEQKAGGKLLLGVLTPLTLSAFGVSGIPLILATGVGAFGISVWGDNFLNGMANSFTNLLSFGIFRRPIYGRIDPLVLDLNGDGIKTSSLADSNAMFDLDGDKFAEKTGWISKDDGLLAIDRNNNSRIDDISELFGNKDKANGFETLHEFDSNKDGVVNANDTLFSQLKVWQDKNGNALVDEGELKGLTDVGIKDINLNYRNTNTENNGNVITQVSTFTRTDGSQGIAGDVDLQLNQVLSRYNGEFELDVDVLSLPWLRGYGNMAALPIAVSQDGKLKTLVQEISAKTNAADVYGRMDELLAQWAGVGGIDPKKMRGAVEERKVAVPIFPCVLCG